MTRTAQLLLVLLAIMILAAANASAAEPKSSPLTKKGKRARIDASQLPPGVIFEEDVPFVAQPLDPWQRLDILYFKQTEQAASRPAIVVLHGGGFSSIGNRKWCHPLMVQLAREGYVTVAVGYRVALAAPYPAQIEDCRTALRWLRANAAKYGVDPGRIGCLGGSAGAVMTALVALVDKSAGMDGKEFLDQSSRVQAAVCLSGSYDARLETYERLNADSHVRRAHPGGMALLFEPDAARRRQLAKQLGVGRADTSAESALAAADWNALKAHPDWARGFSAVTHLTPDDPPLLIFHSENDQLDIRHAREFEQALRAAGRQDPVIVVPGSDHGELLYLRHPDVKEKVHAFLAEHLGSRTNPSAEGGQAVTKQGRTGKAAAAPAASDVEQALVGRRGGTDTGAGRKTIDPAKLPERFKFEAGVGYAGESSAKNQKLDILYFKDSLRRRPAIVMWHGGGFFMGNRSWCHELMAIYAAQGYVTVSADYRLAQEASSPAQLHDAKRAVRWLRANADRYGVDPDRIGCLGGSAGAILSALVAFVDSSAGMEGDGCLAQSSRVQAAVFLSAAYDLRPENLERLEKEKSVQAKFPGGLSLLLERDADKRAALWRQMKSRDDAVVLAADRRAAKEYPDRAAQLSAVAFLSPDDPPFLAVHTEGDQLDVRFAKQFAEVVKAAGRADQVLIMPGDVHGLRQPVAYPEVKRAIDRLFAGHLRHTARRPSSGKP